MGDAEFFAKLNPKRRKSFDEVHKEWQQEIIRDRQRWADRNKPKPKPPETRERVPQVEQLIASGQVIPASQLASKRAEQERLAKDLEEAVRSETSRRRTKIQTEPDKTVAHYTREPFVD